MKKQRIEDLDPCEIDPNELAAEWIAQPKMMHYACRLLAEAEAEELEAKHRFELTEAKLLLGVKSIPESYGWKGSKAPSEAASEALVIAQPDYQKAQREWREAEGKVKVLKANVTTLHQRKAALENAVLLWSRDYGAECKLPKEHSHQAREKLEADRWAGRTQKIEREEG